MECNSRENNKNNEILNIASDLRKIIGLPYFYSFEENDILHKKLLLDFTSSITNAIITDTSVCPLFIIMVGIWSSHYKKERMYVRITNNKNYFKIRKFLQDCLIFLLNKKVDPNIVHNHIHKSTAMHWLIAWDRSYEGSKLIDMINVVQGKWEANSIDAYNRTSINLLIARKYFGRRKQAEIEDNLLISQLLHNNIDLTGQDIFGNTPLHYACLKKDIDFIKMVQKMGQKTNCLSDIVKIKNKNNLTPIDMCDMDYKKSIDIIRSVYDAAQGDEIFNRARWEQEKESFTCYMNSIIR